MRRLGRLFGDASYLAFMDRGEVQLAKILGAILLLVMVVATIQLAAGVAMSLVDPSTRWMGDELTKVLGDLLNLLIALEVLQNITSYLRRHVVQIELVLLTAITAVARKVIVLPPGEEGKPFLLVGLGIAVVSLAGALWMVRNVNLRQAPPRTGPARWNRGRDPLPSRDVDGGV